MYYLPESIIERLKAIIDDNNIVNKLIENDPETILQLYRETQDRKDDVLSNLSSCKTIKDFKEVKKQEEDRVFLKRVYFYLIGNLTVDEITNCTIKHNNK